MYISVLACHIRCHHTVLIYIGVARLIVLPCQQREIAISTRCGNALIQHIILREVHHHRCCSIRNQMDTSRFRSQRLLKECIARIVFLVVRCRIIGNAVNGRKCRDMLY